MRISANKMKAYEKNENCVMGDIVIKQTSSIEYLGRHISIYKMNVDLDYNNLMDAFKDTWGGT